MGTGRRTWAGVLTVLVTGILLAGCTGTTITPQADGAKPVLPAGHQDAEHHDAAHHDAEHAAQSPPPSAQLATAGYRHSGGVVASGGSKAPYNYAPSVLELGGTYRMWWCSQLPGTPRPGDQILYATAPSANGPFVAPNRTPGEEVFGNSPSGFDSLHTCDPSVIEVGGVYYLYYTGTAHSVGNNNSIGLATSTDGVHWTRANRGVAIVSQSGDVRRPNGYGVGQPSALYLNGYFYLMFTDTSGAAATQDGSGQFVLRSPDPAFGRDVESLGQTGFMAVPGTADARTRSIAAATTSDWMWVDALRAFAIATDGSAGTTITFWNADFTYQPYQPVVIGGAQREGPGLVRTADGHAVVSATNPCGQVPVDLVRATGESAGPNGLTHFGVDVDGLHACQQRATALTLLDGFAIPAPDRTVDIVVGDKLVEVERRSVALTLAAGMLTTAPAAVASLPVAAHLKAGAAAVTAPGKPLGITLDDGKLWAIGGPAVAKLNSSPVATITDQEWNAYPRGTDLSDLRP
ncbi:MAG TPA: beta-xylosidase [Pseudonocardiaceae bacterium]|nr:beta-xylosidase [Pseudonocardiaceae bacterium]